MDPSNSFWFEGNNSSDGFRFTSEDPMQTFLEDSPTNISMATGKLTLLVFIEGTNAPPVRMDVEIKSMDELMKVLAKRFGPINYISYFDKDFNMYVQLEQLEKLFELQKARIQVTLASQPQTPQSSISSPSAFNSSTSSMPTLIPNLSQQTTWKQEPVVPTISNSMFSEINDPIDLSSPEHTGFNIPEFDGLNCNSDEPVLTAPVQTPVILTHLRHYQCSGDRNVTPVLVVAVPRDLPGSQEIRATVIDAVDNTDIEHGFSSGNVQAVNLKETVAFKSLKFGRKEHFPGSEIYKVYRIKISLPGTKFEPVYSNPFILLSNPTKQLKRSEVQDLASKWNLNLQNVGFHQPNQNKKRRQTKDPPKEVSKITPEMYNWTAVFNREVKTLITYDEFHSSLAAFFEKLQIQIPREVFAIIEYFLSNMPHKFASEKPDHVSSIQWDLLLKFYGPITSLVDKILDVYNLTCFHGYMTSEDATRLLQGQPGNFLIRYSESEFGLGNYAVTVNRGKNGQDNVQHYATKHYPETNGFIFDNKLYFSMKDFIIDHRKVLVQPLIRSKNLDNSIRLERSPHFKYNTNFENST